MNKQEFKDMFKELCKSGEINLSVDCSNDGYQYVRLTIDGERIFDEIIEND